jgi:hypothetical protein
MTKEEITIENANEVLIRSFVRPETMENQAKAWVVVIDFCRQKGMRFDENTKLSGLQKVLKFIESNLEK